MKQLTFIIILCTALSVSAQTFVMPVDGSLTDTLHAGDSYTILDPGGNDNYPNNSNSLLTIISDSGTVITISGTLHTEYSSDVLHIYDGTVTQGLHLHTYSGLATINDTIYTGVATLTFVSDIALSFSGFNLTISVCGLPDGIVRGETVIESSPDSVVLTWNDDGNTTSWTVVYGTSPTEMGNYIICDTPYVTLNGLLPNTTYFYSVTGANTPNTLCNFRVRKFRTSCLETPSGCIDYSNLASCYVHGTYGTFHNPRQSNGIVDFGSDSILSRHTIHTNTNETDPRTNNQLYTVPPGHTSSVRLGNWDVGNQAETITYEYTVDTNVNDLLLLRYAAVLQVPNHSAAEQPGFSFSILDENENEINSSCYSANFIASTNLGWNYYDEFADLGSNLAGQFAVLWKDWTTVGIDLSPLQGQTIFIRLTTRDCNQSEHYGYAYFVFDCTTKSLTAENCGLQIENTFTAPEGFSYRWWKTSMPYVDLSTSRSLHVTDGGEYRCELTFVGSPAGANCSFELSAIASSRFPTAIMGWDSLYRDDCDLAVQLHNNSVISHDSTHTLLTTIPCDGIEWFIDGQSFSTANDPVATLTPGIHTIQLIASLSGGACTDSVSTTLDIGNPCYVSDTVTASLCQGDTAWLFDTPYTQSGDYVGDSVYHHRTLFLTINPVYRDTVAYTVIENDLPFLFAGILLNNSVTDTVIMLTSQQGCDSIFNLSLTVYPNTYHIIDTTICANQMPFVFLDTLFSGNNSFFTYQFSTINSQGADSTIILNLTINPVDTTVLYATICADQLPYTWQGHTFTGDSTIFNFQFSTLNSHGCDSTVYLNLTVNPLSDTAIFDTIVENQLPYTWNGHTFSSDSPILNYQFSTLNSFGCDSVIDYSLHVWMNIHYEYDTAICDSEMPFTWHEHTFSGDSTFFNYQFSTLNSHGADSTVTLTLTVYPTHNLHYSDTICTDQMPYSWQGHTFDGDSTIFNYHFSIFNSHGCDSTVYLSLIVNPVDNTFLYDTICDNQLPFTWHNHTFVGDSTIFNYQFSIFNSLGCDSTVLLTLTVHPTHHSYQREVICDGMPFVWIDGNTYDISSYAHIDYQNIYGCDSVLHLLLDIDSGFKASMEIAPEVVDLDHPEVRLRDRSESHTRQWFITANPIHNSQFSILNYIDTARLTTFLFPSDEDSVSVVLVARTIAGCVDTVSGKVRCDRAMVWVPNAFTPDEQQNNRFFIVSNGLTSGEVWVYNRVGLLITSFDALTGSWDGTYRGTPCPQGAYTWVLKYTSALNPQISTVKKGTVTLLR